MYDMMSNSALAHVLDQFSVPMFAVERAKSGAPFRFISLNDEMEHAARCTRDDIIGKTLKSVLSDGESNIAKDRMTQCIETRGIVRFREALTFATEPALWDTTLQSAYLPDGRQRVVATSIRHVAPQPSPQETVTFDDIQYFSSMADFQIQNLISMFETYQGSELFEAEAELRIAKLSGMCRTVQRSVADINKSVKKARARNINRSDSARDAHLRSPPTVLKKCGTLKALSDFSTEPSRWKN